VRGWPITYQDFSGGLNTQGGVYLAADNQCREALNVHTSLTGDIEKRNGFVTLSGSTLTGSPINGTGVHTLFPANTSTKSLLGVATTSSTDTIFKMTTAGVASALKTGLAANTRWWFAQSEVNGSAGPIFGLNGTDTPVRWDGSAGSTSEWKASTGEVPKGAKYLTAFSERLWAAEGSRVWYSGITGSTPDPLNWDSENYVDLEPNDGQVITGIGVVGNYLMVFKARKTYAIYDAVTAANRQISNQVGCVAPRSIVQTPAGLFFLSEDQGVCSTDGVKVSPFSDTIKPTLDEVAASPSTQALAAGVLRERRYFLSISTGGTRNDHTLEYDLLSSSWWLHDCATNQYALLDPGGTPVLYSADSTTTARVSKAFVSGTFTDNGAKYKGKSFYVSPYYAWGFSGSIRYLRYIDPHKVKRIPEMRVDGVGAWEALIAFDYSDEFEVIEGEAWETPGSPLGGIFEEADGTKFEGEGDGTFEEQSEVVVDRHYHTVGIGRSASVKYVNDDENNFRILSQTISILVRED
jgi:hypothetical protein